MFDLLGVETMFDVVLQGDCEEVLKTFPDNCVDLIFTSPPYADQRKSTYGGVKSLQGY